MMYTCAEGCMDPSHRHARAPRPAGEHPGAAAGKTAKAKTAAKPVAAKKTAAGTAKVVKGARGRSLRVDIHCHYLNTDVAAQVAQFKPIDKEPSHIYANDLTRAVNQKQMKERGAMLSSIELRLKDMDKMCVDVQAVSPAPFQYYYWAEPGMGRDLSRQVNDRITEIAAKWPERFVGIGTVPLQDADMAVAELERMVKKLGMRGVEINTNVNGLDLTDPKLGLDKFFRKAQELDTVIFIHPMGFTEGRRLFDHYFNNVIGNPMDTTIAASHLIFDGVMKRNPKLKVVLAHGGGYLAHYPGRMDHSHGARKDCRVVIKEKPTTYLKRMYFDTITFDPQMLRFLVDYYGADHVMLGTDYPYDMGDFDPVGSVAAVPRLSKVQREQILGANAAALLKIR
jgi:aminocarboxymuconate-semialdehyde decarboxylase